MNPAAYRHALARLLLGLTLTTLAACGDGETTAPGGDAADSDCGDIVQPDAGFHDVADASLDGGPDVGADYPLDDVLRLQHIQMKGTHNSYHVVPEGNTVPEWNYDHAPLGVQAAEYGIRHFELDVHWDDDRGLVVYHLPLLDAGSTCERFVDCLAELRGWSDDNPGHHPLVISVEAKDDLDRAKISDHYDDLEADILQIWPRERIVTPDEVRGEAPTLRGALEAKGWPTLGVLRGRALFLFLNGSDEAELYLEGHAELAGRLLFLRSNGTPSWASVVEVGNPTRTEDIAAFAARNLLVRTHADDTDPAQLDENPARAQAARDSGAHLIACDYPAPTPLAPGYVFDIEDGTPSRCNPLTAPADCTSEAIEALEP